MVTKNRATYEDGNPKGLKEPVGGLEGVSGVLNDMQSEQIKSIVEQHIYRTSTSHSSSQFNTYPFSL